MHTFRYQSDEYDEIWVQHNGDFSGDVLINLDKSAISSVPLTEDMCEVRIPFDLLQELVLGKIRRDMVSKLEDMSSGQLMEVLSSIA